MCARVRLCVRASSRQRARTRMIWSAVRGESEKKF